MRIADAAAAAETPARLLRYYEEQGLLSPQRDDRGWRVYEEGDLVRIREIRGLLSSGLPISAIRRLVGCLMPDGSTQQDRISDELLAELDSVRDRLDSRIRCLERNRDALDKWLREARR